MAEGAMGMLVVEHDAGRRAGHYMKELEAVTSAMRADGMDVHVLTEGPLAVELEGRTLDGVTVHRTGGAWHRLARAGRRIDAWAMRRHGPVRRPARAAAIAIEQVALVRGVTAVTRALGDVPVLVLSRRIRYESAVMLAPRRARWGKYMQSGPHSGRAIRSAVAWTERRRRSSGGWVRLIVNNPSIASAWRRRHESLDPLVVPLAGTAAVVRVPSRTARERLGLPGDEPVGLLFGRAHHGKDVRTVLAAFAGRDAPLLIAAGDGIRQAVLDLRADAPDAELPRVLVLDGPQTDDCKQLLYSAADYAVLSFQRGHAMDSGTLTDAVSYGIPVCCGDDCATGVLVREANLGVVFTSGDARSLREATERVATFVVRDEDRERFMASRSSQRLTRRLVEATVNG